MHQSSLLPTSSVTIIQLGRITPPMSPSHGRGNNLTNGGLSIELSASEVADPVIGLAADDATVTCFNVRTARVISRPRLVFLAGWSCAYWLVSLVCPHLVCKEPTVSTSLKHCGGFRPSDSYRENCCGLVANIPVSLQMSTSLFSLVSGSNMHNFPVAALSPSLKSHVKSDSSSTSSRYLSCNL